MYNRQKPHGIGDLEIISAVGLEILVVFIEVDGYLVQASRLPSSGPKVEAPVTCLLTCQDNGETADTQITVGMRSCKLSILVTASVVIFGIRWPDEHLTLAGLFVEIMSKLPILRVLSACRAVNYQSS